LQEYGSQDYYGLVDLLRQLGKSGNAK